MKTGKDSCSVCSQKLGMRENADSILLVCTNERCSNYWVNPGSEIVMMLK